ncbi:syntaxin 1B/2/3 [Enteropsectra breve]|nr:syntaxin 1B/2/3 [Enteropsectra breve]
MREFMEASEDIKAKLSKLKTYSEQMEMYMQKKQTSIMNNTQEKALNKKINFINSAFKVQSEEISNAINRNKVETEALIKKKANKGLIQVRKLHTQKHSNDLASELKRYENIQCDCRKQEKDNLKKIFLIAKPQATEKELEALAEGEEGETILASAFALGSKSAQSILKEAKKRRKQIQRIVDMIAALVKLIQEIDKIVESNGEGITELTVHMAKAEENISQANTELTSAREYERRAMWLKRVAAGVAVILVVAIIIIIFRREIGNAATGTGS